jgi:cytochrome c oxidase subunit 2
MGGTVYVMNEADYEAWLNAGGTPAGTMAQKGEALYRELGCATCHEGGSGRAPKLLGVWGSNVELKGGRTVVADAAYLRESIVNPQSKMVNGYEPIMPTFQGLATEDQIQQIIEYIRSAGPGKSNLPATPMRVEQPTRVTEGVPTKSATPGKK